MWIAKYYSTIVDNLTIWYDIKINFMLFSRIKAEVRFSTFIDNFTVIDTIHSLRGATCWWSWKFPLFRPHRSVLDVVSRPLDNHRRTSLQFAAKLVFDLNNKSTNYNRTLSGTNLHLFAIIIIIIGHIISS